MILRSIKGLPDSVKSRVTIESGTATGTIINDDNATISFTATNSTVQERDGFHSFDVRLDAGPGGSISSAVTVNLVDLGTGTASNVDFTLTTPTITFPAGSTTGTTLPVKIALIDDNLQEPSETANFQLSIGTNTIGGAVSISAPSTHTRLKFKMIREPQ